MKQGRFIGILWAVVLFTYRMIMLISPLRILGLTMVKYRVYAYSKYAKIKRKFGADCVICTCAWVGTGDYYFSGMYLRAWLEKKAISNYVFSVASPQHLRILKMFDYISQHTYDMGNNWHVNAFKFFMRDQLADYHYFLFVGGGTSAGFLDMGPRPSYLLGYKGFTILDCYIRLGFNLPRDTVPVPAKFSEDDIALGKLISSSGSVRGKTVLLSPYAASYDGLSQRFWSKITGPLKRRGYRVLTNVGKSQQPLIGTKALFLPYALSVPFLDFAGGFIGIRTGLCDIVSSSTCKKVIVHPYYAINWPDGASLGFTGLKNMGLCEDAVELELSKGNANVQKIIREILKEFP